MWRALIPAALLCLIAGLSGAVTPAAARPAATERIAGVPLTQDSPPCPDASSPNNLVTVNPGDQFTLGLAANRSTGYSWQLAQAPDAAVLQLVGSSYEAPAAGRPGAGGKECWTFNAVGAGTTQLTLAYSRPWEHGVPPARSLTFSVVVRGGGPPPPPGANVPSGFSAVRFVDSDRGWAGGAGTIMATVDGGQTWRQQWNGADVIQSFSLLSGDFGWAVGARSLLRTTDGGQNWSVVAEPPQPIARVAFVSRDLGWGVAAAAGRGPRPALPSGALVVSRDGGRTWQAVDIPGAVQSVCFVDAQRGMAAGNAVVWRTADAGQTWVPSFTSPAASGETTNPRALAGFTADIQCADGAVAWALFTNPGAMMQTGWALYRSDDGGASWAPVAQSGQFFPQTGAPAGHGGWNAVRLAPVDAQTAYLVGTCGPCSPPGSNEEGTVSVGVASDGGRAWDDRPAIAGLSGSAVLAAAPVATFPTAGRGWVVAPSAGQVIYATTDGAQTWAQQYP
jgi:inhibitor of cysteine peptidase